MNDDTRAKMPDDFTGLMIAIPNVSGDMRTELAAALIKAGVMLTKLEIHFNVSWVIGCSAVERARNNLIAKFMKEEKSSHLLMVDDDMDFDEKAILKILSNKHEVCFGAGVKKKRPTAAKPEYAMFPLGRENPICPDCGCIEMGAGGACFMLVSKAAIRRMVEAYPDLWYNDDEHKGEKTYAFFNPFIDGANKIYRAEDVAFYIRWRDIGGRVWLDPTIELGHWGAARWSGNLMDSFTLAEGEEDNGEGQAGEDQQDRAEAAG